MGWTHQRTFSAFAVAVRFAEEGARIASGSLTTVNPSRCAGCGRLSGLPLTFYGPVNCEGWTGRAGAPARTSSALFFQAARPGTGRHCPTASRFRWFDRGRTSCGPLLLRPLAEAVIWAGGVGDGGWR